MRSHRRFAAASLAVFVVQLLAAPTSAAPGIAFAWDHCLSEGTGVQNKVFACNVNTGSHVAVGTFELTRPMPDVSSAEIVLQLASAGAQLPDWWQLSFSGGSPLGCRSGSISANGNANPLDLTCPDWSGGAMFAALATYCTMTGTCVDHPLVPNQARLKVVEAVAPQNAVDLNGLQPYFSFNLLLNNQKTVGTGSCSGCDIPACIVLNSIKVFDVNGGSRFISNASVPGGNFVAWQGGGPNCPGATPTRNQTWGSVKSLYR